MTEQEILKLCVEATLPNNTVIYDDLGNPSIMVRIPKFRVCDVIPGGSDNIHPAFIINNRVVDEIFVSKYSNVINNNRACSLPCACPDTSIRFDEAKAACEAKGTGWHMMSNAEWSAIALMCKKNNFMPRGNNSFSMDVTFPHERGTVCHTYESKGIIREGKTLTGSGPISWTHNNSPAGICDMNGNVWTPVTGLRLFNGEIQIIPDNNSAAYADESEHGSAWRAINEEGNLVIPGSSDDTFHYDGENGKLFLSKEVTALENKWKDSFFGSLQSAYKVPEILKTLALFPTDQEGYGEQKIWINQVGERIPWRGGTWDAFSNSGIFCLFACYPRNHVSMWMGFRASYVKTDNSHKLIL